MIPRDASLLSRRVLISLYPLQLYTFICSILPMAFKAVNMPAVKRKAARMPRTESRGYKKASGSQVLDTGGRDERGKYGRG